MDVLKHGLLQSLLISILNENHMLEFLCFGKALIFFLNLILIHPNL